MEGMIIHCGGEYVTREQLAKLPPPPTKTRTYAPVSYSDFLDVFLHRAEERGFTPTDLAIAIGQKGQQMFATFKVAVPGATAEQTGSIALRTSNNKSLSAAGAGGLHTALCDNLQIFSGSIIEMRKHTPHVWRDLPTMADRVIDGACEAFTQLAAENDRLKTVPVSKEQGYDLIGRAMGFNVLTSTQAIVALGDWKTPRYEEFSDRNGYALVNCFTEALKKGSTNGALKRYARVGAFFSGEVQSGRMAPLRASEAEVVVH